MIRINLLQIKRGRKAIPFPPYLLGTAALLAVSVIGGFVAISYFNSSIAALEQKEKDMQLKLDELTKKIGEVADYEARNKVFQDRKKIIEELREEQSLPVKLFNELSERLTDRVWYTSITIKADTVNLSGVGIENSDIVAFVENLKRSKLFENVYLLETSQTSISGVTAFTFRLSMDLAGKKQPAKKA